MMTPYVFLSLTVTMFLHASRIGKIKSLEKILVKRWTQIYVTLVTTSQHYCRDSRGPCAVCSPWEDLDKSEANKPILLAASFTYKIKTWDKCNLDGLSPSLSFAPRRKLIVRRSEYMEDFLNQTFYHALDPADELFCHNVKIANGRIIAVSFLKAGDPNLVGALSPYQAFTRERPKEEVFEHIRAKEFPNCPSRLGAIFLFDDLDLANKANATWWHGKRVILPANVIEARFIGRYDSKHLDTSAHECKDAARKYWSGILTVNPTPEVLVSGIVQLYGWEPYACLLSSK